MSDITWLDKSESTELAEDDPRRNFTAGDANEVKSAVNSKVDKETGKGLSTNDYSNTEKSKVANLPSDTNTALAGKVDTVAGKGLSTNDYTTAEKNKVANLPSDTNGELSGKANTVHTHEIEDVSGLNAALSGKVDTEAGKGLSEENFTSAEKSKLAGLSNYYKGTFATLAALETAYPTGQPGWEAIVDEAGSIAQKYIWDDTDTAWVIASGSGGASSFADLSGSPSDNPALQSALDAKQNAEAGKGLSANDYTSGDKAKVDNLPSDTSAALAGKANATHTHAISDVTGLQTALDGKAASTHSHAISDVTGLQTALDAKEAASNKATTFATKNDTLYPTTKAVDDNYETKLVNIDSLDADFTPAATDLRRWKRFTGSVTRTITLPSDASVALPVGFTFPFSRAGSGAVQWVAGSGATVNSADTSTKLRVQYSAAQAVKVAANTWLIIGDISI